MLLSAFELPEEEGIIWNQRGERKYRFNRKDGKIYLDLSSQLREIGDKLDVLVLQHFSFSASLFNMEHQDWVLLAFVDPDNVVSIGYLNSGTTGATDAWNDYEDDLRVRKIPVATVITTISFQNKFSKATGNFYYNYRFDARPRKTEAEKKQFEQAKEFMIQFQPLLIDRSLDKEIAEQLFISATGATKELPAKVPAEIGGDTSDLVF